MLLSATLPAPVERLALRYMRNPQRIDLSQDGVGVILVSSELPELLHMADRMVVMSAGRIYDRLDRADFDEKRILQAVFAGHTVKHRENVGV